MTPWTVAHQAPLSMGFSRQEYWSGFPFPSLEDLPDPGIKPRSPTLQADSFLYELQGSSRGFKDGPHQKKKKKRRRRRRRKEKKERNLGGKKKVVIENPFHAQFFFFFLNGYSGLQYIAQGVPITMISMVSYSLSHLFSNTTF